MHAMARTTTQAPRFSTDAQRWQAVTRRDRDADGAFFYAVRTTGVYCRPSCAARLAAARERGLPRDAARTAERAGFRPCKRCRPNQASADDHAAAVAKACRLIDEAEELPRLDGTRRSGGIIAASTSTACSSR